jgi:3-deoxy-D-manno-octulosonate 8-phosphate phosphatase KdsC-like HAD superfamily phosphatase
MRNKPIFVLDMDGCLASQSKIWHETLMVSGESIIGVHKLISDHDSWAIDKLRNKMRLVILSGDERVNRAWADRRKIDFVHTGSPYAEGSNYQDKWDYLQEYFTMKKFTGKPFYYLGDSMPDFTCMVNAAIAFVPADGCCNLIRRLEKTDCVLYRLQRESGKGCFEEATEYLIDIGDIPEEILNE